MRFGQYQIVEELGRGGMCRVFRAKTAKNGQEVALKVIREDKRQDKRIRQAFLNETEISLLIKHKNVIRTLEAGRTLGRHYLAMELVEGRDLRAITRKSIELGYDIPPDYILHIASEALEGLAAIHNFRGADEKPARLVHNDVTPNNVIVSFAGQVLLGDLGGVYSDHFSNREENEFAGKIHYLSPEAVLGEPLDQRSDLFSAGVLLYETLTGVRPFDGSTDDEVAQSIADTRPANPRDFNPRLSRNLAKLILKALAHRARDRFQSAEEFFFALEEHFSQDFANTYTLAHFLEQVYPQESRQYWLKQEHADPRKRPLPPRRDTARASRPMRASSEA